MKFCTYNIWNHDLNYEIRMNQLVALIEKEKIDILGLQEVRSKAFIERLAETCGFQYYHWKKYHDCEEGLAILSRFEIVDKWTNWDTSTDVHNSGSMYISVKYKNLILGITNVHLDHKNALNREIEICKAVKATNYLEADYKIMLGDFNCTPCSSVHGYLTGQTSLLEHSTKWIDLGQSYGSLTNLRPDVTFDCRKNPRWDKHPVLDIPSRYDWILIENPYPNLQPRIDHYGIIGHKRRDNLTPSDHYGVTCVLKFDFIADSLK